MDFLSKLLSQHAAHAHWYIFAFSLLAGCNIPVSIDVLVITAAILAAQFVPENIWLLYSSVLFGCYFSGWIAFFIGKVLGSKLKSKKFFRFVLSEKKISSVKKFYRKYGMLVFIVGRFIPFGVRNALFMTSGISKMSFKRFMLLDAPACLLWVTVSFTLFYRLGNNFDLIWSHLKTFNIYVFLAFSVAVISIFWYKRVNRSRSQKSNLLP